MDANAVSSPCTMCWRVSALARWNWERRRMTLTRKSTKVLRMSVRGSVSGRLPTSAMWMQFMRTWRRVCLKRLLSTTLEEAPLFSSTTTRTPLRSLSSLRSATPSSSRALTSSAMRSTREALLVMYGISVITIASLPSTDFLLFEICSTWVLPLRVKPPRPVSYTFSSSLSLSMMTPPVGKSGAGRNFISCSVVASGWSTR
mmetsp:Transcript_44389/g.74002  ORF Transcript_44389/g.74002 Transcript_44389/m.74002 type:complete len:201 (-) Transcript_44389:1212-1814(-)